MSAWGEVTWTVARAGGFTAYILVTLSVALGLALSMQWQSARRWPRQVNNDLHNFTTLLSLVFVMVHILAVWVDPFTRFGFAEVFIPFVSHYRPLWMGLGIIALYLGLAVALSTLIRPRIGYKMWRRLHLLTLVLFALVTVHGIATGSDTQTWWGLLLYLGAVVAVGGLLCVRLLAPVADGQSHPGIALACGVLVLVGAGWAAAGPLQAGWNVVANNGQGSGARVALAAGNSSSATPSTGATATPGSGSSGSASGGSSGSGNIAGTTILPAFQENVQGTLTQGGTNYAPTFTLQLQASGAVPGSISVALTGQQYGDGTTNITSANMTFKPQAGGTFSGSLNGLDARGSRWQMDAIVSDSGGQSVHVVLALRVSRSGSVSGVAEGIPSGSGGQPTSPQSPTSPQVPGNNL